MTRLVGSHINGYHITGFLGAGGMGEVYRAEQTEIGREIAVKLLNAGHDDPQFRERFINEARIQSNLKHPNIAALYDYIQLDGKPCIVMEHIDGIRLDQRLRAEDWSAPEAARLFRQIVAAISYIHDNGVVHRDIKTSNVKINSNGDAKLLDFGIATELTANRLTKAGSWIGTLQYLAPEQLAGERGGAAVDIWALGILLYEMMTAKLPFFGDSVSQVMQQINTGKYVAPVEHNAALPPQAGAIIRRCLQRKPSARYADAAALLRDAEVLEHELSSGVRVANRGLAGIARDHWPLGLAFAALAVVLGFVLAIALQETPVISGSGQPELTTTQSPATGATVSRVESSLNTQPRVTNGEPSLTQTPKPFEELRKRGIAQTAVTGNQPAGIKQVPVAIDVTAGTAEVWRDDTYITDTPWRFVAPVGENVDVLLKREGFDDYSVRIQINEHSNSYSYSLDRAR